MGISKTDFMRGMQCPKMLWLDKHKPEHKIIPIEVQEKLDLGNEFGDMAMGMFGDFVEATAFKEDGKLDFSKMIKTTKECLEEGVSVICEASFSFCGHFCSVDILRKTEVGYDIYEVKNSPSLTEQHVKDVGFQRYIAIKCGVPVGKCFVVTNSGDDANPYVIEEVTALAKEYSFVVSRKIWDLNKIKFSKEEIEAPMGEQCLFPYECWYKEYCENLQR